MFTKATFFAALVAGASAVAPSYGGEKAPSYGEEKAPGYGGDSYSSTSVYQPKHPKETYPADYPSSSTTPYSPSEPTTYPAVEYPSSKTTPYSPSEPSTYSSKTGDSHKPSTYSSSTCTESTSTEEHPYKPTSAYPSKFTKTSDDYTTAYITGTKTITVTAPHGTYVTTTESVYSTYCPKSEVSKFTVPAYPEKSESKTTPYSPEKPTHPAPGYPQKSSKSEYSPEKPKTYSHGPLTTGVSSTKKVVPSGYTTSESVYDKTLTYTLGHGASSTIITTTIKSTSTILLTKTVYAPKPTGDASKPVETYPKPTGKNENSPKANKPDYECKPETVTVKETVYVTQPYAAPSKSEGPKKPSSAPYYPTGTKSVSSGYAKSTGFATYYTKPSAPVYKPSTESKAVYPSTSTYVAHPVPSYPAKSSTEHKPEQPKPTYPAEYPKSSSTPYSPHKPSTTKDAGKTYTVTPYPEASKTGGKKAPGYGDEKAPTYGEEKAPSY